MDPKLHLRRTDDESLVDALHTLCFPGDDTEPYDASWVLYAGDFPCGFCTARLLKKEPGVFLSRAGVLAPFAGRGAQRRMIRVRERWARAEGADYALTYTTLDNHPSIANLIKSGYQLYKPAHEWGGPNKLYFHKQL